MTFSAWNDATNLSESRHFLFNFIIWVGNQLPLVLQHSRITVFVWNSAKKKRKKMLLAIPKENFIHQIHSTFFFWKYRGADHIAATTILLRQSKTWLLFLMRLIHKTGKSPWIRQSKWKGCDNLKKAVNLRWEIWEKERVTKNYSDWHTWWRRSSHLFTECVLDALQTLTTFKSLGHRNSANT